MPRPLLRLAGCAARNEAGAHDGAPALLAVNARSGEHNDGANGGTRVL